MREISRSMLPRAVASIYDAPRAHRTPSPCPSRRRNGSIPSLPSPWSQTHRTGPKRDLLLVSRRESPGARASEVSGLDNSCGASPAWGTVGTRQTEESWSRGRLLSHGSIVALHIPLGLKPTTARPASRWSKERRLVPSATRVGPSTSTARGKVLRLFGDLRHGAVR
jgi:hypothetical protein